VDGIEPRGLVLDDDAGHRRASTRPFEKDGVDFALHETDASALGALEARCARAQSLDFLVQDLHRPRDPAVPRRDGELQGLAFLRGLRGLDPALLLPGGLRARGLPVLVLSSSLDAAGSAALARLDPHALAIPKPSEPEFFVRSLARLVRGWEQRVLDEVLGSGARVDYDGFRYRGSGVLRLDGPLCEGTMTEVLGGLTRLAHVWRRLEAIAERSRRRSAPLRAPVPQRLRRPSWSAPVPVPSSAGGTD
jgi:hypothetical protein